MLNAGSFLISLDTIDSISAVTFTISLWRSVTNPPVLHVNAWSMLYFALQTHSCGKCLSSHPYLNKTASKNLRLVNGKDESHIEAPSVALSLTFNCVGAILLRMFLRRLS